MDFQTEEGGQRKTCRSVDLPACMHAWNLSRNLPLLSYRITYPHFLELGGREGERRKDMKEEEWCCFGQECRQRRNSCCRIMSNQNIKKVGGMPHPWAEQCMLQRPF
mmetsp:Transcript_19210/g.38752  ORF Transcript_19210/g.38752 Transcript_19210/m.38752 type:complete len:107 (+) Transcript_19210:454-774(+)